MKWLHRIHWISLALCVNFLLKTGNTLLNHKSIWVLILDITGFLIFGFGVIYFFRKLGRQQTL